MDKVLFLAMSGAKQTMLSQQAHANNLANISSTGFKADLEQARAMQVFGEGHPSRVYSLSERPATDRTAGTFLETGRNLDVALGGDNWLAVQAKDGTESYTRSAELHVTAQGLLINGSGLPVLDAGGNAVQLPPFEQIEIAADGSISIRPEGSTASELLLVAQLKMVTLDPQNTYKGIDGLMKVDGGEILEADPNAVLQSGFVESSNVNAVHELTNIISLSRQFEMNIKMMKTAEENSTAAAKILQS
ncbi:MAG: flagellar basal body rod protein FlgF [Oceanospirillaceae bacterium]|nr:flagellar basal body rod protein FlgF [Oceanospirillaceae bacterium]